MPNTDVHIIHTCKLEPTNAHANKGDTFTWVNNTKGIAAIQVSNKHVFGSPYSTVIDPGGRQTSPPVHRDCSYGVYPYSVYCDELRVFIVGSGPKIIVP